MDKEIINQESLEQAIEFQEKSFKYITIKYNANGKVISIDYAMINKFLEEKFIPKHLKVSRFKDEFGNLCYRESISLFKILNLNCNDYETKYIINYLNQNDIIVYGSCSSNNDYENCLYQKHNYRTYLPKPLDDKIQIELFKEYRKTKDKNIRLKLIESNLRLVVLTSYRYQLIEGLNLNEIESYGYEGLITAVDLYNPDLGYAFSTFAVKYIKIYILRNIPSMLNFTRGKFYRNFLKIKQMFEEERDEKLSEHPDMVLEILKYMLEKGIIKEYNYYYLRNYIFKAFPIYLDNYDLEELTYSENFLENLEYESLQEGFKRIFYFLTDEEILVLKLRYGFDNLECKTIREISEICNISYDSTVNLIRRTLTKLRNIIKSNQINLMIPSSFLLDKHLDKITKSIKK